MIFCALLSKNLASNTRMELWKGSSSLWHLCYPKRWPKTQAGVYRKLVGGTALEIISPLQVQYSTIRKKFPSCNYLAHQPWNYYRALSLVCMQEVCWGTTKTVLSCVETFHTAGKLAVSIQVKRRELGFLKKKLFAYFQLQYLEGEALKIIIIKKNRSPLFFLHLN